MIQLELESESEKFKNLVSWVRENGGFVSDVVYLYEGNSIESRCIKVNKDTSLSTKLIQVSNKCCISGENAIDICLKLLIEISKEKDSFFYPFIRMLPSEENLKDLPIYKYSQNDIETFNEICPDFALMLKMFLNEKNKVHEKLTLTDIPQKYKTEEYALYSIAIYHSRAWDKYGFIPLIDFIQHENNPNLGSSLIHDTSSTFYNKKVLKEGDTITWCYSISTGLELYKNYGIKYIENQYIPSIVFFKEGPSKKVKKYQDICLAKNGITDKKVTSIFMDNLNEIQNGILNVSRLCNLTEKDYNSIINNIYEQTKQKNPKIKIKDVNVEPINFNDNNFISLENELITIKNYINLLNSYKNNLCKNYFILQEKYPEFLNIFKKDISIVDKTVNLLKLKWISLLEIQSN